MRTAVAALLFLTAAATAAPPDVSGYPAEIKPAGQYATFVPTAPAASVSYVGLDGVDPVPSALLKDSRTFLLDTRGLKAGRYRFAAVAASKTGEQARADIVVVVGIAPPGPPPGPGPGPTPLPDGELGLRKVSRDGATKVADRTAAKALAGANRATASAVAAGAANKAGVIDPAAALDLWRAGNKASAADPAAWAPWATAASGGLAAAYKGGKLDTSARWAAAFTELADGLDDAGGN